MRRTSGYRTQNYDNVESKDLAGDKASMSSQRSYSNQLQKIPRYSASGQTPDTSATPSASRRPQPSGIPRSGLATPSRLPSASKTHGSRSYSLPSSVDSRTTAEEIPPLPRNPIAGGQALSERIHGDRSSDTASQEDATYVTKAPSQSGLPRRSASESRSSSRPHSRNDQPKSAHPPPPLPSSNSESDSAQDFEASSTIVRDRESTPNSTFWAKDRRRFADSGISPSYAHSRISQVESSSSRFKYEEKSSSVTSARKSAFASKLPSLPPGTNSRAPSQNQIALHAAKPNRIPEERQLLNTDAETRSSSRSTTHSNETFDNRPRSQLAQPQHGYSRRYSTSHNGGNNGIASTRVEPSGANAKDSSRGPQRYNVVDSTRKPEFPSKKIERDAVHISSMEDIPLPTPPMPQTDFVANDRSPEATFVQEEPNTISSPIETLLMGSNTGATLGSRRMSISTPIRRDRKPSAHVPTATSTSATSYARRFSEPSPGNDSGSAHASSKSGSEQHAPPTTLQRIAKHASLSASKSPKASDSVPKGPRTAEKDRSPAEVEHEDVGSPFGLDIVTPRATLEPRVGRLGRETGAIRRDLAQRQKNRQSISSQSSLLVTGGPGKDLRSKVVEDVMGVQGDAGKLGSPFMGDGSPRFGIDERFSSPKARSKSGLRNYTISEPPETDAHELFEYYSSNGMGGSLDRPTGDTRTAAAQASRKEPMRLESRKSSAFSSSIPSNKFGQYQRSENTTANADGRSGDDVSEDGPHMPTPRARTPSRVTFSPNPPEVIRRDTPKSSRSSVDPQFPDPLTEHSVTVDQLPCEDEYGDTFQSDTPSTEFDSTYLRGAGYAQDTSKMAGDHDSQLPVLKKRSTNSALFRALEQPYESSPFSSNTPTDVSSGSLYENTYKTEEVAHIPDNGPGKIYTVSSNLSSLNGDQVGDIRWSSSYELSSATDVLLHNINRSDPVVNRPRVVIQEPTDASTAHETEDEFGGSAYSDDAEYNHGTPNHPDASQSPLAGFFGAGSPSLDKVISVQDKRKAIHESWRAILEGSQQDMTETIDPMESKRQQAIREFHESEEIYVDTLQTILNLFVRPLRAQNQIRWISGLDTGVMRLFDWLDDIANLHDQLLSALDSLRQSNRSVLVRFSETVQPFTSMMELYQPYVVRVEETSKQIAAMTLDPDSTFGEFVRIQSGLLESNQVGLNEMLARPAQRLQEYVEIFKRILTLTTRGHSDYLSTFSLLHSMHAVCSVILEVKSQEEEYTIIKSILGRVRGLPSGVTIATRERRILAQGFLRQVYLPEHLAAPFRIWSTDSLYSSNSTGYSRSGLELNTRVSTTGRSGTSTTKHRYSSTEDHMRSDSSATSYPDAFRDNKKTDRVSFLPHAGSAPPPRTPRPRSRSRSRTGPELIQSIRHDPLDTYVLVLTDLVLLARPVIAAARSAKSPARDSTREECSALDAIGVFHPLDVTDLSEKNGFENLVSLDLFSITDNDVVASALTLPIFFEIPRRLEGEARNDSGSLRLRQEWLAAFQTCYLNALRSLSFGDRPGKHFVLEGQFASRKHPSTASDVLFGGSGFPKSPSEQQDYTECLKQNGTPLVEHVNGEREERDFWSYRFKTVSEEMKKTYEGLCSSIGDITDGRAVSKQYMTKTCRSSGTMI